MSKLEKDIYKLVREVSSIAKRNEENGRPYITLCNCVEIVEPIDYIYKLDLSRPLFFVAWVKGTEWDCTWGIYNGKGTPSDIKAVSDIIDIDGLFNYGFYSNVHEWFDEMINQEGMTLQETSSELANQIIYALQDIIDDGVIIDEATGKIVRKENFVESRRNRRLR